MDHSTQEAEYRLWFLPRCLGPGIELAEQVMVSPDTTEDREKSRGSSPTRGGARGREVYEAKRIRSHYLPLLKGRLPGLCMPLP